MIARIWKGETRASDGDRYAGYLAETGVREVRATAGNRGVLVLRREEAGRERFLFVSFWDSLESIHAFAGDELERARYYPEDERYLLALEPKVEHYTVAARHEAAEARQP